MENKIVVANQSLEIVADISESGLESIQASITESTRRRYRTAWDQFEAWCAGQAVASVPASPATVVNYIAALKDAGKKWATIQLALAAISRAHEANGINPPTKDLLVKTAFRGITRQIGKAQNRAKAAVKEDIWLMLQSLNDDEPRDIRDRALLLIGFNAALRRSELVALNVEDVEPQPRGLLIHIRKSKTDQEGKGHSVAIPSGRTEATCPVVALRRWLDHARIESGAIFRRLDKGGRVLDRLTPQSVRIIIKDRCEAAGLDPKPYSGHSLRAGFATSAALAGASASAIKRTTRHESTAVLDRYVRVADMWRDNAAEKVGL